MTAEIAELVRQMAREVAGPRVVPEEDLEYQLWEAQHDISPAEWWHSLLQAKTGSEKNEADEAFRWLVRAGCTQVDLLEALWEIEGFALSGGGERDLILRERDRKLKTRNRLTDEAFDFGLSEKDRKAVLDAWLVLDNGADQLARLAADAKRDPNAQRNRSVLRLVTMVARRTGQPHYRKLLPLLTVVGAHWKEEALRAMVSRQASSQGQERRKRLAVPKRRDPPRPRGRPKKDTMQVRVRHRFQPDRDNESDE